MLLVWSVSFLMNLYFVLVIGDSRSYWTALVCFAAITFIIEMRGLRK